MSTEPQPQSQWSAGNVVAVIEAVALGPRQTTFSFSVWDDEWEARYQFIEEVSPNAKRQINAAKKIVHPFIQYQDWNFDDIGLPPTTIAVDPPRRVDELAGTPYARGLLKTLHTGALMQMQLEVYTADKNWVVVMLWLNTLNSARQNLPAAREPGHVKFLSVNKRP